MQGANETLVSPSHLSPPPLHSPICSQVDRQWVTKCCLRYLMLLITMAVESQLSPQNQNIFLKHSNGHHFILGGEKLNTMAYFKLKNKTTQL